MTFHYREKEVDFIAFAKDFVNVFDNNLIINLWLHLLCSMFLFNVYVMVSQFVTPYIRGVTFGYPLILWGSKLLPHTLRCHYFGDTYIIHSWHTNILNVAFILPVLKK